ncbi:hypothetical protein [Caldisalinibacter kiritimatiensis]|uniref:Uncharacterized protein n=1 Tax=Caldisalinibacter kiritimatiensis TaxID=1304284 RepID=R1CXZ4_9FIRM|nr:hypothetical protein [Caldisalinibacter kiritimatiensis]EOD01459.1 hypothetical protein L21TH_0506 [Caldisalinibacter kiritimatiensis]
MPKARSSTIASRSSRNTMGQGIGNSEAVEEAASIEETEMATRLEDRIRRSKNGTSLIWNPELEEEMNNY